MLLIQTRRKNPLVYKGLMSPQFLLDSTIFTLNIWTYRPVKTVKTQKSVIPLGAGLSECTLLTIIPTFNTNCQEYKCSCLKKGLTRGHLTDDKIVSGWSSLSFTQLIRFCVDKLH